MARFFESKKFVVKYNNETDDYTSVFFPYEPDPNICRKNADGAVEVMVFASGKTIFSGPSREANHTASTSFVELMRGEYKSNYACSAFPLIKGST